MMHDRLSAGRTMAPERWAALHGIAVLVDHLDRAVQPDPPSRAALVSLTWLLNDPASRAHETHRAAWRLDENPPYRPETAIADLASFASLSLWASRYLQAEIEVALAPLAGSASPEWTWRAVSVLDRPGLLDHARRSLLTPEEQVAVADEFVPKERRLAIDSHESTARHMRSMAGTPEEWVARYGHTLVLGHIFTLRYADPVTDRWMARVFALHRSFEASELLRQQFLTPAEWAAIVHSQGEEL